MASYDSESSNGEEQDYTETSVLLGFASKDSAGETISRLGGRPEWLDAARPPSAALARCRNCGDLMTLLLQLNGELPERFPGHERRLYVFSCRRKSCRRKEGSIRAVRGVKTFASASQPAKVKAAAEETEPKGQATGAPKDKAGSALGEHLFGGKSPSTSPGANPFSTGRAPVNPFASLFAKRQPSGNERDAAKPATEGESGRTTEQTGPSTQKEKANELPKTFAKALNLDGDAKAAEGTYGPTRPPEPWPPEADQPAPYPVSYLSEAEYETLDPTPLPKVPTASSSAMDVDAGGEGGGSSGSGKEDKEVFESSMDSVFQKFADRLAQNPDQAIRYEFGGQPLLYSKADAVGKLLHQQHGEGPEKVAVVGRGSMPRCQNCGAGRVFEVQLTPQAIAELEAEEDGLDGMDWGTVIVGVCEKDCQEKGSAAGEAGYLEEWAGVQWEELTMRR